MSQVRYQPLGPLLSGEGSRAFLGLALEDGAPPRPVVLIWAPQEVTQNSDLTEKLRRETNRAVVFDHPNILRVHGLATLEQGLARVTEYADGETLRRVMEVTPRIPPPLAAKIVADAAMGIHYAHMAGNDDGTPLVHGDVRPETIIISYTGVCKVTGYGALGVAPRERGGRRVRNRRKYSAPEQLLGGREAVNIQTDVFLLGLTLYELLTGKIPFKDSKDADTATLTETLPPLPLTVPRGLDEVVHKATAKRANERYPSALALREAIVSAMGDLPRQDVLATFMNRLFPATDEARAARNKVLEFGMAEAQKQTGAPKPATGSAPTVAPGSRGPAPSTKAPTIPPARAPGAQPASAAPPATGSAAVQPPAPPMGAPTAAPASTPAADQTGAAAPPPVPVQPTAAPRASRLGIPLVLVSLLLICVGAAVVVARDKLPPNVQAFLEKYGGGLSLPSVTPPAPVDPLTLADAGLPADAVILEEDAGVADGGVGAGMDGGMDGGMDAGMDGGTELELIVDPRVEALFTDGGTLGRTPLITSLEPGRYVLSLSNPALGIQTSRAVTVGPEGRTTVRIYLTKGFVNIRAPEGATVLVDGRAVGKAPVEELDLYEGFHRLVVIVNGARWQKSFTVEPNARVTFTVGFENDEEETE
jgi:serine/threonine-protein kinase